MTSIWTSLGDGAWQFVGHLIALASLLTTIFIYKETRSKKRLAYTVRTDLLIVLGDGLKRRLKLLCDGKERDRVSVVSVVIWNSGTVPIMRADFESPISLIFKGKDSEILDAVWLDGPSNVLQAGLVLEGNKVTVVSTLLNPGEQLCFQLMVSGHTQPMEWLYRIVGVTGMVKVDPKPKFDLLEMRVVLLSLLATGFGAILVTGLTILSYPSVSYRYWAILGLLVLCLIFFYGQWAKGLWEIQKAYGKSVSEGTSEPSQPIR